MRRALEFPEEPEEEVNEDARDLMRQVRQPFSLRAPFLTPSQMLQVDAGARPTITAIKRHSYFKSM